MNTEPPGMLDTVVCIVALTLMVCGLTIVACSSDKEDEALECPESDTGAACLVVHVDLASEDAVGQTYRELVNDTLILQLGRPRESASIGCSSYDELAVAATDLDTSLSFSLSTGWVCAFIMGFVFESGVTVDCAGESDPIHLDSGDAQELTVQVECSAWRTPDTAD